MNPQIRSSFIPKKPLPVQSGQQPKKRKKRFDMLSFVGTSLFLVAVLGSGYVYILERTTRNTIDALGVELAEVKENTDFSRVDEFEAFDKKIDTVTRLLRQHHVLSSILTSINERTLHDVGFTKFSFLSEDRGKGPVIGLNGSATTYNALVVQADELRREEFITEFYFDEISVATEGFGAAVDFGLVVNVDPEKLLYVVDEPEDQAEDDVESLEEVEESNE